MKPLVYIESSVISYLKSRPSSDPIKNAWQAVTQQWWESGLGKVTGCISSFVIEEIGAGDSQAAGERISAVSDLVMLDSNADIEALADYLLLGGGLPSKARFDTVILPVRHITVSILY